MAAKSNWLVLELPEKVTADDIEYECDEGENEKAYREGWAEGYNAALDAVKHRLTGGT